MINVPRFQHGDLLAQELIDTYARAITELQGAMQAIRTADRRDIEQAMVYVKNATGGDLDKGQVVGLGDPINNDPTGDLPAFLHGELVLTGERPAESSGHEGKFAVLDQFIPNGGYGVAVAQGIVRVKVEIENVDVAEWADIDDGETGNLLAGKSGSARILWRQGSSTGTVWAVCLIGCGDGIGVSVVEYGHPGGAVSGEKQIVYLIPCDGIGEALPPEKHAPSLYCFIRDDRSAVDVTDRGWNESSILSFVRSSSVGYVGETKVEGVLIGEGLALGSNKVKTNGDDSTAGYLDDEIVVVDPAAPEDYHWLEKQVVLDPLRGDGNDRQFLLTHTDWDANNLTLGGGLTGELTAGNGAEVVVVLPPPGDPYITFQLFKDAYDEKRHSTVLAQLNEQEEPNIKYITIPAKVRTNADDTTPGYLDDEIAVDPGGEAPYWLKKTTTPGGAADNKLLLEHKDFTLEYAEVTVEDLLVYDSSGNGVTEHNASPGTDDGYNYITFALHEVAADDPGHVSIYPDAEPQALLCLKWLAVPAGTADGDTLVWDNTALRWIKTAGGPAVEGGILDADLEAPNNDGIVLRDTQKRLAHGEPIHTAAVWNPKIIVVASGTVNGIDFCYVRYDSRGHLEAYQRDYPYTWFDWPSGSQSADQTGGNS